MAHKSELVLSGEGTEVDLVVCNVNSFPTGGFGRARGMESTKLRRVS